MKILSSGQGFFAKQTLFPSFFGLLDGERVTLVAAAAGTTVFCVLSRPSECSLAGVAEACKAVFIDKPDVNAHRARLVMVTVDTFAGGIRRLE